MRVNTTHTRAHACESYHSSSGISINLQKKVVRAIKLIRSFAKKDIIEVSYSGGKDSDVILKLVQMAGVNYRAIYKNTTIDPPGTISHCIENGVEVMQPKMSFLEIVRKKGIPTRRARFCCDILKEYKVLDKSVQGIRRCESVSRSKRYSETDPLICRIYGNSKKNHVSVLLPILSWSDNDIAEFITAHCIKCHPLYYNEKGEFCHNRRLGCIGCPMQSDTGKSHYKKYPKFFRLVVRAASQWWEEKPHTASHKKFPDIYALIAHNLFYKSYEDWLIANNSIFGRPNWKLLLETYFDIEL